MQLKHLRAIAISALTFIALTYLVAWSPVFTVKKIVVTGLPVSVSEQSIITKSQIVVGDQLARIEPRSIGNALEETSWIKSASISRNWVNGSVSIAITSRVPLGIFQGRALDSDGSLFDLPGKTPAGLPVVSASSPQLGLAAIELFTSLPEDFRDSLLSISASNSSSISSWQNYDGRKIKVQWGSIEKIPLKVSVYRALLMLPENKNVKRVDLSAPHAPIVK
jgi:cell division septal protein FtsQ